MDSFEKYVGQVIDKRYRIMKVIGIGGMAVVFEANDLLMRRSVALKVLKDDITHDKQAVRRFINESKAVSMLSHPNIVNIYDVSVKEDSNLKYIVMELVDGITLKNYILKKGVLSFGETIRITEQILLALHHAHSKGIVHRDIKPQNIMMLKNGAIKVADFGIAKLPNAETVTMTDKAIGTVFYISPEQASGKTIDRRSDIYSLGVTMYEMITGKLPFVSDNPVSVAIMQVKNRPRPPHEINVKIPRGLEQIILGAMEKNPDDRFHSASQMLRHLQQLKNNPATVFKVTSKDSSSKSDSSSKGVKSKTMPSNVRKLTPQKRSSRSMFPIIGGVASAFMIVCIITFIVMLPKLGNAMTQDDSREITVQRLIDTWYSDALKYQLEESGYYKVNVEYVFNDTKERNVIIGQDPMPDEKRKVVPGDPDHIVELNLKVSKGGEFFELPDYSYKDKREAVSDLKNTYEMKVVEKVRSDAYIPLDHVIVTEPAAGESVRVGSEITVIVSEGQTLEDVKIPDLSNMTAAEVKSVLKKSGLEIGKITEVESDKVEPGRVISQSPLYMDGNNTAQKGSKIDIVLSAYPKASTADGDNDTQSAQTG